MSRFTRLSISVAVVAMTMVLVAAKATPAAPPDLSERVEVGQEAPLFELESSDGESLRLAELRGESPLILIFFRGTW